MNGQEFNETRPKYNNHFIFNTSKLIIQDLAINDTSHYRLEVIIQQAKSLLYRLDGIII